MALETTRTISSLPIYAHRSHQIKYKTCHLLALSCALFYNKHANGCESISSRAQHHFFLSARHISRFSHPSARRFDFNMHFSCLICLGRCASAAEISLWILENYKNLLALFVRTYIRAAHPGLWWIYKNDGAAHNRVNKISKPAARVYFNMLIWVIAPAAQ
jgi:hypothetical protein